MLLEKVRILEVKQSVFANNDAQAEKLREELKQKGIYLLNLMSSPGSGKTTTLTRLIELLKEDLKIGVMEADIDSDVDAVTIAATGAKAANNAIAACIDEVLLGTLSIDDAIAQYKADADAALNG